MLNRSCWGWDKDTLVLKKQTKTMIYVRSEERVCVRLCVLDVFDKTVLSVDTVARIYTGLFIVVHQFWPYAYKQVSCI